MKLLYILFLIIISVLSCKVQEERSSSKEIYFEGEVEYKIEYSQYDDRFTESRLKEVIGDRITMFFKDGYYLKKYFRSDGTLIRETYLDLDKNKSFTTQIENDTVYWIDLTKNDSKTTFKRISDSLIMNQSTIGVETKTIVTGSGFNDKSYHVGGRTYFSKNLKVNPLWYKYCVEANTNEIIEIGKGIQLLSINSEIFWTKTVTAKSYKRRMIFRDEIIFQNHSELIYKEL